MKILSDSNDIKDEEKPEQANEKEEEEKQSEKPLEKQQLSPMQIKALNELQIVQFLDNVIEDSLLFVYNKTISQFQYEMEKFIQEANPEFKDIWNENKTEFDNIMKSSMELARQSGYKRSIQKDTLIWSLPLYGAVISASIILYFFVPPEYSLYIMMLPLLILCLSNSLVTKLIMDKRMKFRKMKTPYLKEQMKSSIDKIRSVNQVILNDIKDIIKENNFEPDRFKAYLYNTDYENIKVFESREQQKVPIHLIGIDIED